MDRIKCDIPNCDRKAQYITPTGACFCFGCALEQLKHYFSNPRNPIYETDSWEKYYKKIE